MGIDSIAAYGNVKATKVISDRAGVSKGYGFVTFETEEEAKRLMRDSECIVLKERKLNIAPAIKKQPFNRTYEAASPPTVHSNTIYYQNGVPFTFHNGVAYFPTTPPQHAAPAGPMPTAGDPTAVYQTTFGPPPAAATHTPAATAYPVIYPCTAPPTMYMTPQQFQYQPMPPQAPASQYVYATSTSSASAAAPGSGPPPSPATQGSPMLGAPAPLPPAQHFYTHMNPTDLYYSVPQPYMISNEGIVYETPPQTETSSNQSAEDSCSNSSNSDTVRSGGGGNFKMLQTQENSVANCDNKLPSQQTQRQNSSTPVVSLLKLEDAENKSPAFYQQVPPPPVHKMPPPALLYPAIPPMYIPNHQTAGSLPYHYSSGVPNGHCDQNRPSYNSKPFVNRRNSTSSLPANIPPFPSKFHLMNNNNNNNNNNNFMKRQYNRGYNMRGGRYQGPSSRRFFPVKREDGHPMSPPPAPYSPMVPSDSSCVSPPQQVQFRNAVPPPPRRFVNSTRKSNGNNGNCRSNGNNGGKYKSVLSVKVVDEGGAGDAPVQETCNQMQALTL
ncbi:hypothetical protein C0J52_05077 [Blattella germanica]|nr:hypothetical protein C0J52_05077 [Blattella germanica]